MCAKITLINLLLKFNLFIILSYTCPFLLVVAGVGGGGGVTLVSQFSLACPHNQSVSSIMYHHTLITTTVMITLPQKSWPSTCICTCSAQLSMFHMEKRSRIMLIIIIIIIINTYHYIFIARARDLRICISKMNPLLPQ